jgi:hypothetical protein
MIVTQMKYFFLLNKTLRNVGVFNAHPGLSLWCLMPFSTIFQLYRDSQKWDTIQQQNKFKDNNMKTRKNCFRYLKLMSPLNAAICTTVSYTWVEWYYLKNNYLTLRSKVKVPRRSLRYATHRPMVIHPHIKYHWRYCSSKFNF